MHEYITNCFAVIYIPFYALQCARQRQILEQCALDNRPWGQLSLEVIEADIPRAEEKGVFDDASSDSPAALLDREGIHVI